MKRDPAMEVDEMDDDEVDADLQAARERERDKDKPKEPVRKYTKEEKTARIARWKEKKPRRKFSNLIRYECRKKFADHRRREGGRFVAKTPEERLAHEEKKRKEKEEKARLKREKKYSKLKLKEEERARKRKLKDQKAALVGLVENTLYFSARKKEEQFRKKKRVV